MKKIISFSLWGNDPKYIQGALENIKCRDKYLSDWICRFYIHESVSAQHKHNISSQPLCEIIDKTGSLGTHMDKPGMFWRFEVLNDKDVERFIIRDADSRINQRDIACINHWIKSDKEFHIIRDHPYHNTKIMGGMWGATKKFMDKINYNELLNEFNNSEYQNTFATDQEFLARKIYPMAKHVALIHDNADRFREGAYKIPHINIDGNFVGKPIDP